jgi:hypothetical protein
VSALLTVWRETAARRATSTIVTRGDVPSEVIVVLPLLDRSDLDLPLI